MDRYDIYKELVDAGVSTKSADTLSAKAIDVTKYDFATPHDINILKHDLVAEFRKYSDQTEKLENKIRYSIKWDKFYLIFLIMITSTFLLGAFINLAKTVSTVEEADALIEKLNHEVKALKNLKEHKPEKSE